MAEAVAGAGAPTTGPGVLVDMSLVGAEAEPGPEPGRSDATGRLAGTLGWSPGLLGRLVAATRVGDPLPDAGDGAGVRRRAPGAAGEADATYRRLADRLLALAERAAAELRGAEQGAWLERLDVEHDDLRQALRWALDTGARDTGLRLVGALWWYWATRGRFGEGQRWLEAVLAGGGTAAAGAPGAVRRRRRCWRRPPCAGWGTSAAARGDYGRARTALERALALSQDDGDEGGAAAALTQLGVLARNRGEYGVATALHDRALAAMRRLGDSRGVAVSLGHLGGLARARGDYDAAWAHHEASLAGWRSLGDRWGTAYALDHLGVLARDRGDLARAAGLHEEALGIRRALGDRAGLAGTLNNLGAVARGRGDFPRAEALVAEALASAAPWATAPAWPRP